MNTEIIDLLALNKLRNSDENFVLLDVSSTEEFAQGHEKEAVNIPLAILSFVIEERFPEKETLYLVQGACDNRAFRAVTLLEQKGYKNLKILTKGEGDKCSF